MSWRVRAWILIGLLSGPLFVQAALGLVWIWEQGRVAATIATLMWVVSGAVFAVLARRWAKAARAVAPPLDWDAPEDFAPFDREAWRLVSQIARQSDSIDQHTLMSSSLYIETGRDLFDRLARHYHPGSSHALDDVPLVDLLAALELAAEDLAGLCRQLPGGDFVTLAHWRRAVQTASLLSKVSDIYAYLIPLLNPLGGLVRLTARELIVKPAWKLTQQDLLRWFYMAYVNRLGVHFIELLSGRLAAGAEQYRRLTRPAGAAEVVAAPQLVVVSAAAGPEQPLLDRFQSSVFQRPWQTGSGDHSLLDRLAAARWVVHGIADPASPASTKGTKTKLVRQFREAVDGHLLLLALGGQPASDDRLLAFAQNWSRFFNEHRQRKPPPILLLTPGDLDDVEPLEDPIAIAARTLLRARVSALERAFPPRSLEVLPLPDGQLTLSTLAKTRPVLERVIQAAEKLAVLRSLQLESERSTLSRLARQARAAGGLLLDHLRGQRDSSRTSRG